MLQNNKVIIYAKLSDKGGIFTALSEILKEKYNCDVKFLNSNFYKSDEFVKCDLAFVWSFAREKKVIIDDHIKNNIPIIVIENGYFNREYFSFGINKHYYLPKKEVSDERFKEIFTDEIKPRKLNKGNKILLADRGCLKNWFSKLIKRLPKNKEIIFRPHPLRQNEFLKGVKKESGKVKWDEVFAVITDCSAFGNEALINGVPVFCQAKASYSCLGNIINNDIDFSKPKKPNKKDIENYFRRLCLTQYKRNELDKMINFIEGEIYEK